MSDMREVSGNHVPLLVQIVNQFEGNAELKDLIAFNETYQNIQFLKDWNKCKKDTYLEDEHESFLLYYLTQHLKRNINKGQLADGITEIAHRKIIRPVRDYLDKLEWDRVPRLGTWLHRYAGTDDNEYTGQAGKIVLTAAVARIYEPGVKFDYLLILEGPQRTGKSTLVKTIGGKWYLDMALKDSDKEIIDELRGCWIVEMGELAGFNKKDIDWLKSFLSRQVDRCRLSYGRRSKDFSRQVIFVGTMNPSGDNTYFRDDTGNLRFWPVLCRNIDIPGLTEARDQLFAEAKAVYFNLRKQKDEGIITGDYPFYLQDKAFQIAEEEQRQREIIDPWEMDVLRIITGKMHVTAMQILCDIGVPVSQRGQYELIRIGKILKKFRWHKKQIADGTRVYTREEEVKHQGRYAKVNEEISWEESPL